MPEIYIMMHSSIFKKYRSYIRIILSVGLFLLFISKVSFDDILVLFQATKIWPYLVIVLLLPALSLYIMSCRLYFLLCTFDNKFTFLKLFVINLISSFYNQIFPSTIGGDVARSYWLNKINNGCNFIKTNDILESFTVVAVDRILGVFGILTLSAVALVLNYSMLGDSFFTLLFAFFAVVIFLFLSGFLIFKVQIGKYIKYRVLNKIIEKVIVVRDSLHFYKNQKEYLLFGFLLSIVVQVVIIFQYWFLSIMFQLNISLYNIAVIIPIVTFASMLPVTINGIGIRENMLFFLGSSVGFTVESAFLVAYSFLGIKVLWGFLGGMFNMRFQIQKFVET